jgi:hypothetical protein
MLLSTYFALRTSYFVLLFYCIFFPTLSILGTP